MLLLPILIVTTISVTSGRSVVPESSKASTKWRYIGCYTDKRPRDLTSYHKLTADRYGMSVSRCYDFCSGYNNLYMALQNGNECRCDNGFGRYGKEEESMCDEPCTKGSGDNGDGDEMCGGDWSNSVYQIRDKAATEITSGMMKLSSADRKLSFTALGDWGREGSHQRRVARRLADWSEQHKSAFTAAIGDNFYETGVYSVKDKKFQTTWKNVYTQKSLQHPWLVIEGNHDYYDGNAANQVKYGKTDSRWVMPSLYYSMHYSVGGQDVHFIFLDTDPIRQEAEYHQYKWFKNELSESKADWIIVMGHHPIASAGSHGKASSTASMYDNIRGELVKHRAALYICGHDHFLQHMVDRSGVVDYIISGSGAKRSTSTYPASLLNLKEKRINSKFLHRDYGFVGFEIEGKVIKVSYIDEDGHEVYSFSKVNPRATGPVIG